MRQITNLTDSALQRTTVLLEDNSSVVLDFRFLPVVQRWVVDVTYGAFAVKGMGVCVHPNLLRTFRRRIPFGLMCSTPDGVDPFKIDDFSLDRASVFVLDSTGGETEVEDTETNFFTP